MDVLVLGKAKEVTKPGLVRLQKEILRFREVLKPRGHITVF